MRRALLLLVFGAIAFAIYRFAGRRETPVAAPPQPPKTVDVEVVKPPVPAHPRLETRLDMPPPSVATTVVPDACAHGAAPSSEFWDCLPRTPSWDAQRAAYLRDRLVKYVGLELRDDQIECRTRCCRLELTKQQYQSTQQDLATAIGVRIGPVDGYLSNSSPTQPDGYQVVTCWKDGDIGDYRDRAVERDALITAAKWDLQECGRSLPGPTTLELTIYVDEDGGIQGITALGGPAPEDVRDASPASPFVTCVETALRKYAAFEPSPEVARDVPVYIRLEP